MIYNLEIFDKKVRQSNHLIESPYSQDFSPNEIKVFEVGCAKISMEDVKYAQHRMNRRFAITARELATLLNTSVSTISHEIEKIAERLMKKTINLRRITVDGAIEFEMINIIPYAKYKDGIFEYELNHAVIPYLVEIREQFTEFVLSNLLCLSSASTIKIYKLLMQYKNLRKRVFHLSEFKNQLGLSNKYPQYKNLKQKIIDPSIKQINEKTDMNVEYTEIKFGRKVEKLEFRFNLKKSNKQLVAPISVTTEDYIPTNSIQIEEIIDAEIIEEFTLIDKMLGNKANEVISKTKNFLKEIIVARGAEFVECSIDYAKKYAKSNFEKYLLDTITNNWAELEIQKTVAKKVSVKKQQDSQKQQDEQRKLEQAQADANRSEIEHLYYKLTDEEQQPYLDLACNVYDKNKSKLDRFKCSPDLLKFSVFAVSNNRYYNRVIEAHIMSYMNISLSINDYLV